MSNYYFLITAFPPLTLGVKPEISFQELKEMLRMNLTSSDMKQVERLLRPIDLYNMRAFWLGLPLDEKGNFNAKELEEELLVQDTLPPYVVDFLARYEAIPDRLRYFASLFASFYREEKGDGFLKQYFQLDREIRLNLTALRAKMMGRDLGRELQFEDPTDPLIAEILAQKDAPDFTPSKEFEDLKTFFLDQSSEPRRLSQTIIQYRLDRIEEMEEPQDFGIDRVLAYVARFLLVEAWAQLDEEKGKVEVEKLSQYE